MTRGIRIRSWLAPLSIALAAVFGAEAGAQSFCSSDRQTQPTRLLERFISADCSACWSDAAERAGPNELALDWIVRGSKGDEAPLSAAASSDALLRLEALKRAAPTEVDAARHRVQAPKRGLRVSHGLPFNGYLGTSIELKSPQPGTWTAWLLLVETIPAGSEGSAVERNLVRNALRVAWGASVPLTRSELSRLYETRPMSIPDGAQPGRLSVVGWMEDGRGRIRAIAQSRCAAPAAGG